MEGQSSVWDEDNAVASFLSRSRPKKGQRKRKTSGDNVHNTHQESLNRNHVHMSPERWKREARDIFQIKQSSSEDEEGKEAIAQELRLSQSGANAGGNTSANTAQSLQMSSLPENLLLLEEPVYSENPRFYRAPVIQAMRESLMPRPLVHEVGSGWQRLLDHAEKGCM